MGLTASKPLEVLKSSDETDGSFVRFELTLYPRDPQRETSLSHNRWSIDFPTEHVHPLQDEHWRVISGGLAVANGDTETTLSPAESITLPAGIPHRIWNPLDEPSRVVLEFRPALDAQSLTETLYMLAQRGETNDTGQLKLLQFAVTQDAHPNQLYLTAVPIFLQRILIRLLAPIGRFRGYQAVYHLDYPG